MPKVLNNGKKEQICRTAAYREITVICQKDPTSRLQFGLNAQRERIKNSIKKGGSAKLVSRISATLFNDFVRLDHYALWYQNAKLLRGLEIDENFEFGW